MAAKIPSNGVNLTDFTVSGTTPFVTIGDAGAEDAGIIFDGNAQDFYVALDDSADSLLIGVGASVGTTSCIVVDANGHVTKPLQSAFSATRSATQSNLDINAGAAIVIAMATEIFDQNADYNTSTSTFTAPVTGKYQLNFYSYMADVDDDFAYLQLDLVTSNRQYNLILENSGEDGYDNFSISVLADMDASDTAVVKIQGSGGADQLDLTQSGFSGFLAC